jgi:hypothetical protein
LTKVFVPFADEFFKSMLESVLKPVSTAFEQWTPPSLPCGAGLASGDFQGTGLCASLVWRREGSFLQRISPRKFLSETFRVVRCLIRKVDTRMRNVQFFSQFKIR